MPKYIVKVSGGKASFRIVIPQQIVKKMGWEEVKYVTVEYFHPAFIKIRKVFDDETSKRSD